MPDINSQLTNLLDDASFVRWIRGKATQQDQSRWDRWERSSELHAEIARRARMLYELPLEVTGGDDLEDQLAYLQARIDDRKNIFRIAPVKRRRGRSYRMAVAATMVLVVAVVGLLTYFTGQQTAKTGSEEPLFSTIEVGFGERGALKISDGSSIRLNANSTLRYSPEQFSRSKVEVWLKGEGYFSIVNHPGNSERTFIVHTPDGDIRVLGTRFNVNTRFSRTGVVLEEGRIEVRMRGTRSGVAGRLILKPGQRAQFSSNQTEVHVQPVDTLLYTAWLDGKLVFRETPLGEIIENIEQIYGVSILVDEPSLLEERISGSLRNPNLKTLLEGLETVLNLEIRKESDDKYLFRMKTTDLRD